MKKNQIYKGFKVIDVIDVEDLDSKGIYLRHEKSGMEVFHLLNNDRENLFAFAFRTPPQDSTGAAHVLEHSVLCGSRKYPAKDPFLQLAKQSINTYLNAFTASDRTVFPSSSLIKADYFNIMSVYADAVFFPLLRKETFLQECWRPEPDAKGKPSIQGVVFNEMKGNYASFNGVAGDVVFENLVPGSIYDNDSGGDPLVIPSLTVEKLRAFHKKYYCTNNCLVFLYGDIPTEEQLDFLDANVLSKVKSYGKKTVIKDPGVKKPIKNCRGFAPADEDAKSDDGVTLAMSWRLGKNITDSANVSCEILMLSDLLLGSDSAPMRRALLKKFPKSAVSPLSGPSTTSWHNFFTIAFSEMKENQKQEFRQTIEDVLEDLCRKGYSQDDIDRALMDFEIKNLEVKRSIGGGPYSLSVLRQVLRGWTYGMEPWKFIDIRGETEAFKENLAADKDYLKKITRKYFLDNDQDSLCVIVPSGEYTKKRNAEEESMAKKIAAKKSSDEIQKDLLSMEKYQKSENSQCVIPSVSVADLEVVDDGIKVKKSMVNGVPLQTCEEPCNGVVYASLDFPVDVLAPEDFLYLPLLEETLTDMGWGGLSWEETSAKADKITGYFTAGIRRAPVADCNRKYVADNPLIAGREWLSIRVKFLEDKMDEVLSLIEDCISGVDFSDTKRLKTIICGAYSGLASNIVPHAHYYATMRTMRTISRFTAINEIMDGITCLETFSRLRKAKTSEVSERLRKMFSKIRSSGCVMHVTADRKGLALARKRFAVLAENLHLTYPKAPRKTKLSEFLKLSEVKGVKGKSSTPAVDEVFLIPGDIGFACCAVESSAYGTKEHVEDMVVAHTLEKSELWNKVRMAGGAYGVFMSVNGDLNTTRFGSYRDPKPFESLETFRLVLEGLDGREMKQSEIDHSICGVYADDIEPMTPQSKGGCGMMRAMYGGSSSACNRTTARLLKVDEKGAARSRRRYRNAKKKGSTVVFCGKSMVSSEIREKCGNIVKLNI
ncbi:MAG: insulinase family protein [Treponema sp.]|nr:insulinase family protein [Candidatus Treponema equi]